MFLNELEYVHIDIFSVFAILNCLFLANLNN